MELTNLEKIWSELCEEAASSQQSLSRVYRALGKTAVGVRASFVPAEAVYELLVEVPVSWEKGRSLPQWRGLRLNVLSESIPPREAHQLSLALVDEEARDIFLHFAADLVTSLEGISDPAIRVEQVVECTERWNRFFERCGSTGLSETAQRGLFAELLWLEHVLDLAIEPKSAICSWKGCQRGYHDFDFLGSVVEVKSTISKEPRRVWISNERQLDDRGLNSLHLFVVTLQITEGGRTLPELVNALRQQLETYASARAHFNRCLISDGYLDSHQAKYCSGYAVKAEELFSVRKDFPRIVDVPSGVGNLRYCVVLGACQEFKTDIDELLKKIQEITNA